MENLVTDSISIEEFEIGFSSLSWQSVKEYDTFEKDSKRVKNFHLNPKSYGFCGLATSIFLQFEVLEDEEKRLKIMSKVLFRRSYSIYNLEFF